VLAAFRQRSLTATEAAGQLGVTGSRLYMLATDYLRACARKEADSWLPGTSGGAHTTT
jgi:3-dehydroquinate dehydratase